LELATGWWWKEKNGMWQKLKTILLVCTWVIGGLCVLALAACSDAHGDQQSVAAARALERAERRAERVAESKRFADEWDRRERERDARWEKMEADSEAERQRLEELSESRPKKRRARRIRRFEWESPAETRGKLWNVPEEESEEATLTAFLRVCIAEADGRQQDCVGIWQVVKNNRRRSCDRGMIRRITECVEGEGETFLSALRRHQRHVLGYIKARNKRAVWISQMTLDCENPPEAFLPGESEAVRLNRWDAMYQKTCSHVISDGRHLIKGELPPARPGQTARWLPHRPLTWGGRCESGRGACDDRIACSRGLNRIPDTNTLNAFWCRPGRGGCPEGIDPVCEQYRRVHEQPAVTARETEPVREPSS
jgi:hypothetical protein